MNINCQNLPVTELQRALVPDGGNKCVPITLDFAANATYNLDMQNFQALSYLNMVQTVWVDNFGNGSILKITIPASQQVLQIPAGVQGYFPVLCPNPVRMQFDSAGGTRQQVILMNFPVIG
jgi:hypothetical protein